MDRLIITGASGFIGAAVRAKAPHAEPLSLAGPEWRTCLEAVDLRGASILHLGARAHSRSSDNDESFADAIEKARALGEKAARAKARVLVFASSIKVNGEESSSAPFGPHDMPRPEDAYGRSKLAAENALREISAAGELPLHIVRPPLVYGAHARGNLATLLRWCDSPWPLPFASVRNRRSFIALADLVSLFLACVQRPMPGTSVWMAAHDTPISTPDLIRAVRSAMGRAPRLYPVPPGVLDRAAGVVGRQAWMRRLTRSLHADASSTYAAFDWHPRIDATAAIDEMVRR